MNSSCTQRVYNLAFNTMVILLQKLVNGNENNLKEKKGNKILKHRGGMAVWAMATQTS